MIRVAASTFGLSTAKRFSSIIAFATPQQIFTKSFCLLDVILFCRLLFHSHNPVASFFS